MTTIAGQSDLSPRLREALLAEIDSAETLRWAGQPSPGRIFWRAMRGSLGGAAVLLLMGGTLAVLVYSTWQEIHGLPSILPSEGRPPTMAGIWGMGAFSALFLAGAVGAAMYPWFARATARDTVYALTTTRVLKLLVIGHGRGQVDAVEPGHPLAISRRDHADGTGDILLYPRPQGGTAQMVLIGVREPREVERLIRNTFDPPGTIR